MPGTAKPAFDWDDANLEHIGRHKVGADEVEQAMFEAALPIESEERGGEERHTELGETASGRLLVVVWTWRRGRIRVVTAFPANRKWRALWRRIRGGGDAQEKAGGDVNRV